MKPDEGTINKNKAKEKNVVITKITAKSVKNVSKENQNCVGFVTPFKRQKTGTQSSKKLGTKGPDTTAQTDNAA